MSAVMPPAMSSPLRRPIRWESWALTAEADRRFRRIAGGVGIVMVGIAILFSLIELQTTKQGGGTFNGDRFVELLPDQPEAEVAPQAEEPKPAKENQPSPPQESAPVKKETRPVDKPVKPIPDQTENARKIAEKSGILALKDSLSDLRDPNLNALNNNQPLITGTLTSKGGVGASSAAGNPDSISASAASASGGIGGYGSGDVTSTQSGAGVGTRRTSTVKSPLGFGRDKSRAGDDGKDATGGRSLAELQQIFDRNKAAFYAILNRAQRENPDMGTGKIVVSLTIASNGSVIACSLVSSSFHDSDLERKIIERVKLLNFGAKNVPPFTYPNYPINYIPS